MNTCILQILKRKDGLHIDGLSGMYIKEYDPYLDAEMKYTLVVCDRPEEAKIFLDPNEARAYYQRASPNHSLNGKPNRPLTDWNVIVIPFDHKA